jgi:hypothetical protein
MKKNLLSLMLMLLLAFVGVARAEVVTIGDLESAGNNSYLPMNSLYEYSYSQQIYTAEEIGMAGTINSITMWMYGNTNLYEMPFDIYMLEVDKDSFSGTTDWVVVSESDMVYSGSVLVHNTSAEPYTFELATPFEYSGQGNLLIAFNNTTGSWKSGLNGKVFGTSDNPIRSIYVRRDGTAYNPYDPSFTATSTTYQRNVVEIDIVESSTCEAPYNFQVTEIGPHQAYLTWTGSTGSFNLDYKKASESTWINFMTEGGWNCVLMGLDDNTTYQARVQANCPDGTTSSWKTVTFVTREACAAPTGLQIAEGSLTAHGVTMTWDAEEGEYFQYAMLIGILYDPTTVNWGQEEINNAPTWINLIPDTDYTFFVRRWCDDIDQSEAVFMSFHTPVSCLAPYDLTVVEVTDNSVTLGWTESGEATQWQICFDDDETQFILTSNNPSTIGGIEPNTIYTAKVRAYCSESDQSYWSNTVTFEYSTKPIIGSGTATNNYIPTYAYYNYSLTQQIYTAEEIGIQGEISSIDFYNASSNERTRSLDVYMVNTDKTSFESNTDWITALENDLVFSGAVTFAANAWTSIELPNSFTYNGSNLAIIVDDNTGTWESSPSFYVFPASNQAIRVYSDDTNYDPYAPTSYNGTILNVKNQLRLGIEGTPISLNTVTVSAEPEYGGYVSGGGNYLPGSTCTITATPYYGYRFINWTDANGNIVTTEPSYTFTLTSDMEFVAHFEALPAYEIIVMVNPEGTGYAYGGGTYYLGDTIYIEAYPYYLYDFVNWTNENGDIVSTENGFVYGIANNATFIANFAPISTTLAASTDTIDLGPRPNGAWMRPVQFTVTNFGFPTTVQELGTSNDYFVVNQGNLTVPFTLDNYQSVAMTVAPDPESTVTGAVSADFIITYLEGENTASYNVPMTAMAYTPVTGDVWENPIEVNQFPYTATVNAATTPYYNNYVMPYPNIPDGYDVVYKLTFEQDTYLNASVLEDATTITNGKVALYPEGFKGLGGPDENNYYTNPKSAVGGAPFEAQIGDGTNTQGHAPFYTLYDNSLATMLFHADELENAGATTADMTSLSWYANNETGYAQQGISIWMANVNDDEVTYTSPLSTGMTLVYTGTMTPAIGWNEFFFNENNFAWDGSSNVLILCQRNNGSWNSTVQWLSHNTEFYSRSYTYRDGTPYDVETTQYGMNISNTRPNTIMKSELGRAEIGGNRDDLELTVHDGTSSNSYVPVYGFYADAYLKSETVYPAEELSEMAGGEISKITYYASSPATAVWTSTFQVFMTEVEETSLDAYHDFTGMTPLYEGILDGTGSEMEINFETPYQYNGGNLLIAVYSTSTGNYKSVTWAGETVSGASIQGYNYSSLDAVSATQRNFIPKTTFTYAPGGTVGPQITDMTVVPGVYYLVASATSDEFTVNIETSEVPCPEPATVVSPADQAFVENYVTSVPLRWKLDDRATEYCLRFGTDPDNLETIVNWTDTLAERYTASNLNYHTAYYWQVCERNDGCPNGVEGPVWRFTTTINGPTDLYPLNGYEIIEGDTLRLTWTAPTETSRSFMYYTVEGWYWDADGQYVEAFTANTNDTYYEVDSLEYISTAPYYFTVWALYDINYGIPYAARTNIIDIYVMAESEVQGHVYEQDGSTGIANATVTLYGYDDYGYWHQYDFTTDENGAYSGDVVLSECFSAYANAGGYQEVGYEECIVVEHNTATTGIDFIMDEVFSPTFDVEAEYYPDPNVYDGDAVKVTWADQNWHTYCEYEFDNAWRHNSGTTSWGYYYPAEVLAPYIGYSLDKVSVFSDNMYSAVGGNYTCNIYEGGETPNQGALVSTITVDVPQGKNAWMKYALTTPVEITENTGNLWVIWTANTSLGGWPAGCCSSNNDNGNWWYDYFEAIWTHQYGYCWTMRNHFSDGEGRSVVLGAPDVKPNTSNMTADNAPARVAANGESASCINPNPTRVPLRQPDRSLQYYRVYRTDYYNYDQLTVDNAVLVADSVTTTSIIDETFGDLEMGTYKYGVSCVYEGNRESRIVWIQERFGTDEMETQKILSKLNRNESALLIDESFEEGIPEGWNIIDADGDGRNWDLASELMGNYYYPHTGNDMICSESYGTSVGPLYPDNYIVTPQVELGGTFSFWACAQDSEYAAEHFGVAVSTYNNSYPYYFNTIQEWTLSSRGQGANNAITRSNSRSTGNWQQYTVDLSAYAGQYGYIAIRHFGCSGMFYLDVDDIQLTAPYVPQPLQGPRESEIAWSNPVDRDMYLYNNVDITVTLNSGDSPEGVWVSFGQYNEQYNINPLNSTLSFYMDETGFHAWDVFRKGEYYVYIWKEGYQEVYSEWMYIGEETHLVFELEEIMESVNDLYVSRTGWASWKGLGNEAPALTNNHIGATMYEGFENGLNGWTVINVNPEGGTWVHSDNNPVGRDYTGLAHDGIGFAMCYSYVDYVGAYNTDSYLVSPQKYPITSATMLNFWADNYSESYPESISVCVATVDNPTESDFTPIWNGYAKGNGGEKPAVRPIENTRSGNWRYHSIDLSAYAGQEVWIAFHDVNYDMWEIWIDEVELRDMNATRHYVESHLTLTTTEGETLYMGTTENNYMQLPTEALEEGQVYKVRVSQAYSAGLTSYETTCTWVYAPCDNLAGANDLTGYTDTTGLVLSWSYPVVNDSMSTRNRSAWVFEQGFVTDEGVMVDGSDASWTKGAQSTWGPNVNYNNGYWLADDFTLEFETTINEIEVYGYQTGSSTTSTFTGLYVQIYNGNPMYGAEVVWGDMYTNLMTATAFTNCYRGSDGDTQAMTRPIMSITASNLEIMLEPGTYYLAYALTGNGSSGPWGAPYCLPGYGNTGDGVQYVDNYWQHLSDSGSGSTYGCAMNLSGFHGDPEPSPIGDPFAAAIFRNGEWIGYTVDPMFTDPEGTEEDTYEVRIVYSGAKQCPYNNAYFSMSCPQTVLFPHEITAIANPTEGGTVTGEGTYYYGDTCTLTATANENYAFINWTDADGVEVSTEAEYSFMVTADAAFVANFELTTIVQTTSLALNWNWWSTYVEADDLIEQLEASLGANGMTIKSQNGFVQYLADYDIWYGSQNFSITNEAFYMIQTSAACDVQISGLPANPTEHPITLSHGWNWIGYPNNVHLPFTTAFSNITPSDNDQVKSQSHGFASYMEAYSIWYGTLSDYGIDPGMGLMYKSNNNTAFDFTYPTERSESETAYTVEDNHWMADYHTYAENMTITAVVELDDVELNSDNYELAAFANGELRGSARLLYVEPLHRYMAFLTVPGDEAVEISFGLYDNTTGMENFNSVDGLVYTTNAVVGNMSEPLVVRFRSTTSIADLESNLHVYPNPVNHGERFSIDLPEGSKVRVEIVNALGTVLSTETSTKAPASILAPNTAGVYTLRITVEGKGTYCRKLVVK